MQPDVQVLHDDLVDVLRGGDEQRLREHLALLKPADVAELMELVEDLDRSRIMFALDSRTAAEVVSLLDERVLGEVVDDLSEDEFARIIIALPPDDAADVLGDLPTEDSEELLGRLPKAQSLQIGKLLKYGEATAGGLMNPTVVSFPADRTVREAIEALRKRTLNDDDVLQMYVTDANRRLVGTLPPHRLLLAGPEVLLGDLMDPDPLSVTVDEHQEAILQIFRKYSLTSLPVVDEEHRLVGHVTVDDVMDVAVEEADEDFYHMAGTEAAELETSSTVRAAWIRFRWLVPSFFFMTCTASVIFASRGWYPDSRAYEALVAFVPMIGALAGCCSVQTSTVITRGLATGELAARKIGWVFDREGRIILLMAPACAVVAWLLAWVEMPVLQWLDKIDDLVPVHQIALAVGLGMLAAILVAAFLGILMPFMFRHLGIDPAIAAGPVVTAANDVLSVSIYLLLAIWVVD